MSEVTRTPGWWRAIVGLAVVIACARAGRGGPPKAVPATTTAPAATSRPLPRYAVVGEVVAPAIAVPARGAGRLISTRFRVADPVRRGDFLAGLDPRPAIAKLDATRLDYDAARSELARARADSQPGDRPAVAAALKKVEAVQGRMQAVELEIDGTRVLAPCAGVVTKLDVPLGGLVAVGQGVVEIVPTGPAGLSFDVPSEVGRRIRAGTAVRVESVLGTPIAPAAGVVTDVTSGDRTPVAVSHVTARLATERADLPPGSSVTITVDLAN